MKPSLPPKLVEELVWVSVISFCKMSFSVTHLMPYYAEGDRFWPLIALTLWNFFNSHLFWLNSHPATFLDHDQGLLNLNIRRIQDLIEVGRV
jgi:hypothetical protein